MGGEKGSEGKREGGSEGGCECGSECSRDIGGWDGAWHIMIVDGYWKRGPSQGGWRGGGVGGWEGCGCVCVWERLCKEVVLDFLRDGQLPRLRQVLLQHGHVLREVQKKLRADRCWNR